MSLPPGKAGDEIKKILCTISLLVLENCLRNGQYSAASEVREMLWEKMDPRSVQVCGLDTFIFIESVCIPFHHYNLLLLDGLLLSLIL